MIVKRLQGVGGVSMQPPYWWFQYGLWDLRVKCQCGHEAWLFGIKRTEQYGPSMRVYGPNRCCGDCGVHEVLTLTDFPSKLELDYELERFRSHPIYGTRSK
jgi:hypothetical protein